MIQGEMSFFLSPLYTAGIRLGVGRLPLAAAACRCNRRPGCSFIVLFFNISRIHSTGVMFPLEASLYQGRHITITPSSMASPGLSPTPCRWAPPPRHSCTCPWSWSIPTGGRSVGHTSLLLDYRAVWWGIILILQAHFKSQRFFGLLIGCVRKRSV